MRARLRQRPTEPAGRRVSHAFLGADSGSPYAQIRGVFRLALSSSLK